MRPDHRCRQRLRRCSRRLTAVLVGSMLDRVKAQDIVFANDTRGASADGHSTLSPRGILYMIGCSIYKLSERKTRFWMYSAGDLFAGYTIVRCLGVDAIGEVYLAQHPRLPRYDTLKILSTELAANRDFCERFVREADMAASLSHDHIVAIHDRGEFEGRLWISMSYVEGTAAGTLLTREYPSGMPRARVLEIVSAVRTRSTTRTRAGCCIATSSPRTYCWVTSHRADEFFWRTSGLRESSVKSADLLRRTCSWGPPFTARPSSCRGWSLMGEPTSMHSDVRRFIC